MEAFHAAMEGGADAVYLSPRILNARAYGRNFSMEEIGHLVDTAHGRGRKVLVALNSLMKEAEIPDAVKLLAALDEMDVDALIIQDLGLWRICRKHFPGLRLHASTLMTIHNSAGVKIAEKMGFSRVVLARELTLKEIAAIARSCKTELEVFVHGAMCFTMSGLCLFSSYFGGRSSTRGKCVQPCRRRYTWKGAPGTFFSMDDLCGLEAVPELARLGIASLKIEGRLKPADYIASVTKAYRMVLDADDQSFQVALDQARDMVNRAMGRPMSSGYFFSENPRSAISPTRTANTGLYVGKVTRFEGKILHLSGTRSPEPGDMLRIVLARKELQFSTRCLEVEDEGKGRWQIKIKHVPKGQHADLPGALVFKTMSTRPTGREMAAKSRHAQAVMEKRFQGGAQKKADRIIRQIAASKKRSKQAGEKTGRPEIFLKLASSADLKMAGNLAFSGIILEISSGNIRSVTRKLPRGISKERIIWALPPVVFQKGLGPLERQVETLLSQGFRNFQVSNLSHLALFSRRRGKKRPNLLSSYQMNILNSQAIKAAKSIGISQCHFSIETDVSNMKQALSACGEKALFTVFGFVPLFTSRLRHRTYSSKTPAKSTRGEEYFWKLSGGTGELFAKAPFSALGLHKKLMDAGATRWILDFSSLPGKTRLPRRIPSNLDALASKFRGRSFNLLKGLE